TRPAARSTRHCTMPAAIFAPTWRGAGSTPPSRSRRISDGNDQLRGDARTDARAGEQRDRLRRVLRAARSLRRARARRARRARSSPGPARAPRRLPRLPRGAREPARSRQQRTTLLAAVSPPAGRHLRLERIIAGTEREVLDAVRSGLDIAHRVL